MKTTHRHSFATFLVTCFVLFDFTACDPSVQEERESAAAPSATTVTPSATDPVKLVDCEPGDHAITEEELSEVMSHRDFAETMEILKDDGDTVDLHAGISVISNDETCTLEIQFKPVNERGYPSINSRELMYQRSKDGSARFYFATSETDCSAAPKDAPAPKSNESIFGCNWSSWKFIYATCEYRWGCLFSHHALILYEQRTSSKCGFQTRLYRSHCGC